MHCAATASIDATAKLRGVTILFRYTFGSGNSLHSDRCDPARSLQVPAIAQNRPPARRRATGWVHVPSTPPPRGQRSAIRAWTPFHAPSLVVLDRITPESETPFRQICESREDTIKSATFRPTIIALRQSLSDDMKHGAHGKRNSPACHPNSSTNFTEKDGRWDAE